MRFTPAVTVLAALALAGCPSENLPLPIDGGTDGGAPPDAPTPDIDGGVDDGGVDDGGADDGGVADGGADDGGGLPDGGPPTGSSTPAPPAEIVRMGTGGFLLRGAAVLAPTGPIAPGEVLIVGNTIRCVAADCSTDPMAATVTVIDTHATIAPGLIDAHDHLSYDFLGEWVPDPSRLFVSRYEWRSDVDYSNHVDPEGYQELIGGRMVDVAICPGSKWGELRSIIHGTTTVQGQSTPNRTCLDRLARNADQYHGLGDDFMRVTIAGPCESSFPARAGLITDFGDGDARRFVVHVGEGHAPHGTPGSSSDPTREFDCYAGRTGPTPGLLFDGAGTAYETAVMIHAVPLTTAELDEAVLANVRFVWSPSSNIVLYDHTAPIAEMLSRGLTVALANDWTVSGTDEMLSEMRYASDYAAATGITAITPRTLFDMTTADAAEVLGMEASVGRLAPGLRADVAVFGRVAADPYRAVLDSRAADVRLTMIDGAGYYGDIGLEAATAVNGSCETLDACGIERFVCVQNTPGNANGAGDTLESIETELRRILAVFGREDELLPLIDCSL